MHEIFVDGRVSIQKDFTGDTLLISRPLFEGYCSATPDVYSPATDSK